MSIMPETDNNQFRIADMFLRDDHAETVCPLYRQKKDLKSVRYVPKDVWLSEKQVDRVNRNMWEVRIYRGLQDIKQILDARKR